MTSHPTNYTPLIPLAGFIAGLTLQLHLQPTSIFFCCMVTLLVAVVICWHYWLRAYAGRMMLIACLTCWAGYLIGLYHETTWEHKERALMAGPFTVQGYVSDVVPLQSRPYLAAVHITIETLEQSDNPYNYQQCTILHYIPCKQAPAVGSGATFTAIKPAKKMPAGEFANYVRKNNIVHQLFSKHDMAAYNYTTQAAALTPQARYRQWLSTVRANFYHRITTALSPLSKLYAGLMFFGTKEAGSDDIRILFSRWGLAHFLARSGLHIVIFVFLVSLLLRAVPVHSRIKDLFLFVICLMYDALSWSSVSFLRAWLIAILIIVRTFLGRHTSYLHLLSLSCISILAYNPCHVISLDFQLTYALTFALTLLSDFFKQPAAHKPALKA